MAKIIIGVSPFGQPVPKTKCTLLRRHMGQWAGYEERTLSDTFKVPVAKHIEHPEVLLLLGAHDTDSLHAVIGRRDFTALVVDETNRKVLPIAFPRPLLFQELPMM